MRYCSIGGTAHRSADGVPKQRREGGKSVLVNVVGNAAEDAGAGTIGAEIGGTATVLRIERSLFPLDIAAAIGQVQALTFLCRSQLPLLRVDRPIGLLADGSRRRSRVRQAFG